MKRAVSVLLLLVMTAAWLPFAPPPAAQAASGSNYIYLPPEDRAVAAARNFSVVNDKFTLDGREIAIGVMSRYEFIHLPEDIATSADRAWEAFDSEPPRALSDRMKSGKHSVYRFGARDGDVIYLREKNLSGGLAGNWAVVKIQGAMLAMASGNEHLVYMEQATEFTIKVENPYTYYEYAIKQDGVASTYLEWIPAASPDGVSMEITGYTVPRSARYTVIARVSGDPNAANYRDCVGRVYDKVMLDLRSETLALGGVNKREDTVYHVTVKGKKTIYNVASGTDFYIPLGKLIGSASVDVTVEQQLPVETTPDSPPSAKKQPLPTTPILIKTIKPRPNTASSLTQITFISNDNPAAWSVDGAVTSALEYAPPGKTNVVWTRFDRKKGLPLLTTTQQAAKQKATSYQIRSAPDNVTMTPASKPKKFAQPKQVKAPAMKPDYKKEIVKLKAGMFFYIGALSDNLLLATFKDASQEPILSITDALTDNRAVFIYQKENGKKSRSAIQTIILAKRFTAVDFNEGGLITEKSKVKLQKGFEALNDDKQKWGGLPKGQNSVQVRQKTTAKYNAKTNSNTGNAASPPVLFQITYDGKKAIAAACRSKGPSGLEVLRVYNGPVSLDVPYNPDINDYTLGVREGANTPLSFSLQASGASVEASSRSRISVRVTSSNRIVVGGARVGDAIDILVIPNNIHEQRTENITVTVGLPFTPTPQSVAWKAGEGERGVFTVSFGEDMPLAGDVIEWQLFAAVKGKDEEPHAAGSLTVSAQDAANGTLAFTVNDCAAYISSYFDLYPREPEAYFRVQARLSRENYTPSRVASTSTLTVDRSRDFLLSVVRFYSLSGNELYNLTTGDTLVLYALDSLGNAITVASGADIKWYRGLRMNEILSGAVVTTGTITYQISAADNNNYIGVTISIDGATRSFVTLGRVGGSGANLMLLEVANGKPVLTAGMAFTAFGDAYEAPLINIFSITQEYGALRAIMADNSTDASVSYYFSDTRLAAAPASSSWSAWPTGGPPAATHRKYLYIRAVSADTAEANRETKYYCFEFALLPAPVLSLTSDFDEENRVVQMAVGEIINAAVFTEGRGGVMLGLYGTAGAGLIAEVHMRNDSVATVQSLAITGGVIDIGFYARQIGVAYADVYIYPIGAYAGKFEFENPTNWLGNSATMLTLTVYVSDIAHDD
ncbi:MAG: hypothetical protein LBI44_05860 [Oscillospiraceae bacterium]|jgi:hypothetical protein|nr:hypothetical protein [Oscillospiraceae bacterium]